MLVSQLSLPCKVQTKTDAIALLTDERARQSYIAQYGNQVVVASEEAKDGNNPRRWERNIYPWIVPAFGSN